MQIVAWHLHMDDLAEGAIAQVFIGTPKIAVRIAIEDIARTNGLATICTYTGHSGQLVAQYTEYDFIHIVKNHFFCKIE